MTNKPDEQSKCLTISGTNRFRDVLRQVTKLSLSLCQYKDKPIAITDIFQ